MNVNQSIKKVIVLAALTSSVSLASAGPFGLNMGMTIQQVKALGVQLKATKIGWFEAKRLPKNLDSFTFFELQIEPGIGLCRLRAIGRTIQSNSFGEQLKAEFESTEQLLIQAYGQNKKYDYLTPDSIWSNDNDWIISLLKKERKLTAFWGKYEGSNMKDGVSGIQLEANVMNTMKGYIDVVYEFDNFSLCSAKTNSRESDSL